MKGEDICNSCCFLFQSLTGGTAFYHNTEKEQCSEYRKIVLQNKETKEFIDDFTARNKGLHLIRSRNKSPIKINNYIFLINVSDYQSVDCLLSDIWKTTPNSSCALQTKYTMYITFWGAEPKLVCNYTYAQLTVYVVLQSQSERYWDWDYLTS